MEEAGRKGGARSCASRTADDDKGSKGGAQGWENAGFLSCAAALES